VASNSIEVHVHNLRKKLGERVIRTLRGAGYVLADERAAAGPRWPRSAASSS